jgi:hypothetical protein
MQKNVICYAGRANGSLPFVHLLADKQTLENRLQTD